MRTVSSWDMFPNYPAVLKSTTSLLFSVSKTISSWSYTGLFILSFLSFTSVPFDLLSELLSSFLCISKLASPTIKHQFFDNFRQFSLFQLTICITRNLILCLVRMVGLLLESFSSSLWLNPLLSFFSGGLQKWM